jgi:O-antigen ligase
MPFRILIVLLGGIGAALAAVAYPFLGLLAMLFLNFGRPQDDRPNIDALHIPMMITIAVLIGTVIRIGSTGPALVSGMKRLKVVFVLFSLYLISALNNWTALSSNRLYELTVLITFCVLTLTWVISEKRLRVYLLGLLASGAFVILQVLRNPTHIHEEISGEKFARLSMAKGGTVFGNSNYLALFMVIIIFLTVTLVGYYRPVWQRIALVTLAGSAAYAFFRANSRGASLALATGMLVLFLMGKNKFKNAIIALVLMCAGAVLAPQAYWDRLSTVTRYQEDASATDRLELWQIALNLIAEHPVLGVGPDNFILYAPNTPHNAYLQVTSELGIPAFLVYVSVLMTGLYSAWRARQLSSPDRHGSGYIHAVSQGILCCILAVVVQGFTTGLAHREVVYVFVTLGFCAQTLAAKTQGSAQSETTPQEQGALVHSDSGLTSSPHLTE